MPFAQWTTSVDLDPREFSPEDSLFLKDWAHWMSALARQEIAPTTREQTHFVSVTKGEASAETHEERLWMRYHALTKCRRCHRKVPSSDYSNSICPRCISTAQWETKIPTLQLKQPAVEPKRRIDPLGLAILREAENQARE